MYTCYYIAITEAGKKGDPLTRTFFKEEYTLNFTIGQFSIVYNRLYRLVENSFCAISYSMCYGEQLKEFVFEGLRELRKPLN